MAAEDLKAWETFEPSIRDCIEKLGLAKDTLDLVEELLQVAELLDIGLSKLGTCAWPASYLAVAGSKILAGDAETLPLAKVAADLAGQYDPPPAAAQDGNFETSIPPMVHFVTSAHDLVSRLFVRKLSAEDRRMTLDLIDELIQATELVDLGLLPGSNYPASFVSSAAANILIGADGLVPFAHTVGELARGLEPARMDTMGSLSRIVATCLSLCKALFTRPPPGEPPIRQVEIYIRRLLKEKFAHFYKGVNVYPIRRVDKLSWIESTAIETGWATAVLDEHEDEDVDIAFKAEARLSHPAEVTDRCNRAYRKIVRNTYSELRRQIKEYVCPSMAKLCLYCKMLEIEVHEGVPTAITAIRSANLQLVNLIEYLKDALHMFCYTGLLVVEERRRKELQQ